jgi:hypothetical protein
MKRFGKLGLVAVVAFLFVTMGLGTARANLVTNGDFGTGDFTGWTPTYASSGSVLHVITSTYTGSGPAITPPPGFTYEAGFGANQGLDDTISQSLMTTPGQEYTFTFLLAHNWTDLAGQADHFEVYWGGQSLLNLSGTTSAFPWTEYSFDVVASGSSTTITFAGSETPAWYALDGVSVNPVPIPPSVLLFAPGLFGLTAIRRRFKK